MAFNTDNQLSLSFKTLINKEFTTTAKAFYEEFGANTINTNTTEVWSSIVSSTPATAVSDNVARYMEDFTLSPLVGFTTSVFYFGSGSGFTTGSTINRGTVDENNLQRNFISDKYGSAYAAVLKQSDGTVVPATDNSNWLFNYTTGILSVTNPGGHSLPYKISVYQYTGQFLSQSLGGGSGFPFAGDAVISGSLLISSSAAEEPALTISGSSEFDGSINASSITSSFQGDLVGTASTASYVTTAQTASYVTTAQTASYVTTAQTASYVAGANVDGAVASATDAAAAASLSAGATGVDLTLSGDLSVAGTASFTNTNNLSIKDKYILVASGSAGASDGGIVVEQAADGKGALLAYDSGTSRWGLTSSFDPATAAGYTPNAFMGTVVSGLGAIGDVPSNYNKAGNIFIDSSNVAHIYTDKWEKIIVSGSSAIVNTITAPGIVAAGSVSSGNNVLTIDANGLIHMTGSYGGGGASGIFIETGSYFATTNDLQVTGSLVASSLTSSNMISAGGQAINIGSPSDAAYSDGFFDTFTSATSLANAIDEISEAFLDLAPAKAGVLGSTALDLSGATQYSGLLAYGLVSDHWYQNGYAAGQSAPFVKDGTFNLATTSTSDKFRAGKNSDLVANTLEGGVTASVKFRNAAATLTTRALDPDGTGTTAPLNITSLDQYNTFWVKANAQVEQSIGADDTGSYQYKILADNGAGETNDKNLMWVGSSTHYPNPTVTPGTVTSASVTYNELSGIKYLKTATFTVPGQAGNMFNPVYQVDNVQWRSTYWTNALGGTSGTDTPNFGDTLNYTKDLALLSNLDSAQSAPDATIRVFKPGDLQTDSSAFDISHTPVNSYVSAQSTATVEPFLDEDKRVTSDYTTAWTSTNALSSGELQVQNGRLVTGNTGDYSGFTGIQYFFRKFTGMSVGGASGTFDLDNGSNVFSSLNEWGSGAGIQAILVDVDDLTGTSPSKVYDLGKAQANTGSPSTVSVPGNASAQHFGVKTGTVSELAGNWSLGTNGTIGASGTLVLVIAIVNPDATNQLNQITITG
jgi:hypothetical protein